MKSFNVKLAVLYMAAITLIATLMISGCSSKNTAGTRETGKEPYEIGAIIDISGTNSLVGLHEQYTLQMLVDQLNAAGGINGRQVNLTIIDNKSNEIEAALAAKKLIEQKVLAVIGCSASDTSMAIINTLQSAKVPMISMGAASTIVEPVEERLWIFKTAESNVVAVGKITDYLKDKGITKVAFLYMNSVYGNSGKKDFAAAAKSAGLDIVAEDKFEAGDKDMTSQLTKVKSSPAQAVVVWAIPPSASIVTKNFRDLGLSIPLIQSPCVGTRNFIDLMLAEGVIVPVAKLDVTSQLPDSDPQKKVLLSYIEDFTQKYNIPPNSFGGYSADAFNLLVEAIKKAGTDRSAIRDQLEKAQNIVGISGVFNMSAQDHNGLQDDSMVLAKIQNGQCSLLK